MIAAETRLVACTLAAATCWLCTAYVHPHRVRLADERQTQQYATLLGQQRRLILFATLLTAAAVVAFLALPTAVNPDLRDLRWATESCGKQESPYDPPICYALQPGGIWVIEEIRADRTHMAIATMPYPPFKRTP